jgi:ABC-type transport system involved in multi-copper enzyme maturation permease subunit
MLEGIKVLNQTEIMTDCTWAEIIGFIFCGIAIIGLIAFFVLSVCYADEKALGIAMVAEILGVIICAFFFLLSVTLKQPTGKYEYEVTIDDSVNMIAFYERYEVIEVSGKIYTIRER